MDIKIKDFGVVLSIVFLAAVISFLMCTRIEKIVTPISLNDTIAKYSDIYGVGTPLIKAIIYSESRYKKGRIRCDRPALEHAGWMSNVIQKYNLDPEDDITYSSMGYMQVLTARAILEGMDKNNPLMLLNTETNIKYGVKILRGLWEVYQNKYDVIAAYNFGSVKTFYSHKDKCYKYWNHQYVTETIDVMNKYDKELYK